jgi:hypothetical protein
MNQGYFPRTEKNGQVYICCSKRVGSKVVQLRLKSIGKFDEFKCKAYFYDPEELESIATQKLKEYINRHPEDIQKIVVHKLGNQPAAEPIEQMSVEAFKERYLQNCVKVKENGS